MLFRSIINIDAFSNVVRNGAIADRGIGIRAIDSSAEPFIRIPAYGAICDGGTGIIVAIYSAAPISQIPADVASVYLGVG